jgi:hypothetical protein
MHTITRPSHGSVRGISLLGLIFWAIVVGFIALLGLRVFPSLNEYWTLKRAVQKIATENPPTVAEVKRSFQRQQAVEYAISNVSADDLEITKEGDKLVIRFAYDKQIEIVDPVFLTIKYKGEGRAR